MATKREGTNDGDGGPMQKRRAIDTEDSEGPVIYILKNKISSSHLTHLKKLAVKNCLQVSEKFDNHVTHVITSLTSYDKIVSLIESDSFRRDLEIVSVNWLTDTFIEGRPPQVTDKYRICRPKRPPDVLETQPTQEKTIIKTTEYECQRPTLLDHPNTHITNALELLEKYHQHLDYKQGDTRALAFRQAACAVKALPRKVTSCDEVSKLHRIGKHSLRVIQEVIENGFSKEVEDLTSSSWFKCMELFTSVYGCGPATADKWCQLGLRTIDDVRSCESVKLTEAQRLGLLYFDEISSPIPRAEVETITQFIKQEVDLCCPGASVEAVGGYRRGKPQSHDVDLLLSHKDSKLCSKLLETVVHHLKTKGMVIHTDMTVGQNTLAQVQSTHDNSTQSTYTPQGKQRRVKFDHLDKAFCILKLDTLKKQEDEGQGSGNIIRRIDLIVAPSEQYPYALVSWTGSKQFNRSLRRYAVKECHKTVTAHGIYDIIEKKFIKADTEKEIFDILNFEYLEPHQRNC